MKYNVYIIHDAEQDILSIFEYIASADSSKKAAHVYSKLKEKCMFLSHLPKKGHVPPELERIDVYDYREIHFKPYRIIYQITGKDVYIHCILDGRRTLQTILEKRLLEQP